MRQSKTNKHERVKGLLYTLKTMNGKPFDFKEVKVGYNYESAIKKSGLFKIKSGIVHWTHPNGISDSIVDKIIAEAQAKGREYNQKKREKETIYTATIPFEGKMDDSMTHEILNHGVTFSPKNDKEQLDRIEAKLDKLLNQLL